MALNYIVVQAGGKGSRLEHLTANKPKAIVPVENLPMIFHLFRKFPDKRFIIIADYKKEVLREYLECFADVKYQVVDAEGTGTCSGIGQAVALLPENTPFMLLWSDLILPQAFKLPEDGCNYVGVSQTFPCRWSYENGLFAHSPSTERGVAGLFVFESKQMLANVPQSGEFVRWLGERGIAFQDIGLAGTREFGLLSEYEALACEKCRPFNRMTTDGDVLIKEGIDEQGRRLAKLETQWYKHAIEKGVRNIPAIYDMSPLRMERVQGKNIHEYDSLTYDEKYQVLEKLVGALKQLHSLEHVPSDSFSMKDAYYTKTIHRLYKVRDLIPFADQRTIIVNGRECRNVFFYKRDLERALDLLKCESFAFIHGDCTFSNLILKNGTEPVFIDPRGYFGCTELYGDENYDWAKLYYSIAGNYDRFNLKDFRLELENNQVKLSIASNQWEIMEQDFFQLSGTDPKAIKLLHAIIWLSLTTYAWQDYDSICGAFYNGLYYLEEVL